MKPIRRSVWSGSGRTATPDGFNLQISGWAGPQESVTKKEVPAGCGPPIKQYGDAVTQAVTARP